MLSVAGVVTVFSNLLLCVAVAAGDAPRSDVAAQDGSLSLLIEPSSLVLKDDAPAPARARAVAVDGQGRPLHSAEIELRASAGSIVDADRSRPAEVAATLRRPATIHPRSVVVVAANLSALATGHPPRVAFAVVRYAAAIDLKGHTEPRAQMQVVVGERTFGPASADARGRFTIPVVVPAGLAWATGISTDRLGNASRSRINLFLPPIDHLHAFVLPDLAVADGRGRAWICVAHTDDAGRPQSSPLRVTAARGQVLDAVEVAPGLTLHAYRAPEGIGVGEDTVRVTERRSRQRATATLTLLAARPEQLRLQVRPSLVAADGAASVEVTAVATDAFGSEAAGHDVVLELQGKSIDAQEVSPGTYRAVIPPRRSVGQHDLRILLRPRAHRCLAPRLAAAETGPRVVDERGVPCTGTYAVLGAHGEPMLSAQLTAAGELGSGGRALQMLAQPGVSMVADSGLPRRVMRSAREDGGSSGAVLVAPVLEQGATVTWRLPSPIDLSIRELSRQGGFVRVQISAAGVSDLAQRLRVQASAGIVQVQPVAVGVLEARIEQAAPPFDVVATDPESGVSAWLRVE